MRTVKRSRKGSRFGLILMLPSGARLDPAGTPRLEGHVLGSAVANRVSSESSTFARGTAVPIQFDHKAGSFAVATSPTAGSRGGSMEHFGGNAAGGRGKWEEAPGTLGHRTQAVTRGTAVRMQTPPSVVEPVEEGDPEAPAGRAGRAVQALQGAAGTGELVRTAAPGSAG